MRRPSVSNKNSTKALPAVDFMKCLAKTHDSSIGLSAGRSVYDHCRIVGELAKRIFDLFPRGTLGTVTSDEVGFIAALHDIGKVSPDFQNKIKEILESKSTSGISKLKSSKEQIYQFHGGATYITLRDIGLPEYLSWALGSHHKILYKTPLIPISSTASFLGGPNWQTEREKLFDALKQYFSPNLKIENYPSGQSRVLAGISQQADWLASGNRFDDPSLNWKVLLDDCLIEAGYESSPIRPGLTFSDIFGFEARTIQKNFIDTIQGPGIYVLEAPMGIGKTEAALYAAYKLLATKQARGIYFALPTRLTSMKILERMNEFLAKIQETKVLHSHLVTGGNLSGEFLPGKAWFSQKYRKILDQFGVGTIDQSLMAVMLNKRSFVTLSGLAGKVVILDEVHSYDSYTRVFIDVLIRELFKLGCTVLILSATLSKQSRRELLNIQASNSLSEPQNNYPLITAVTLGNDFIQLPQPVEHSKTVDIVLAKNTPETINEAIKRAAEGQQVLWIENSVRDAQAIYSLLQAANTRTIEVGLLHSRYLPEHRKQVEDYWVSILGKDYKQRSLKGRILVGTQILEQSLDIDADYLITRLAPMDMLLQRLGRLWRHKQTNRTNCSRCEAVVLIPNSYTQTLMDVPQDFKSTFTVYHPYILMRTLKTLFKFSTTWHIPECVRDLIESVYSESNSEPELENLKQVMLQGSKNKPGIESMRQQAKLAMNTENCQETRLSQPSTNILIVKNISVDKKLNSTNITLLNGLKFSLPWYPKDTKLQSQLAKLVEEQMVSIYKTQDVDNTNLDVLKEELHLNKYLYVGDEETSIWIVTVDESGQLYSFGTNAKTNFCYKFDDSLGYTGLQNLKGIV